MSNLEVEKRLGTQIKRGLFVLAALLCFREVTPVVAASQPERGGTPTQEWSQFSVGEQVYGEALRVIDGFYTAPHEGAPELANKTIKDYQSALFIPSHHELDRGDALRLRIVDGTWAQVLRENDLYNPFQQNGSPTPYSGEVYVHLADFQPVEQLEPLNVLDGTQPQDKLITVVEYPFPQILVWEKGSLILRTPVVLGADTDETRTSLGDYKIPLLRISTHMPDYPGVPWDLQFNAQKGQFLHGAVWENWLAIKTALEQQYWGVDLYQSHGCVNLPDDDAFDVSVHGEQMTVARFLFQWAMTNYPTFDPSKDEEVFVAWNDPQREESLRVVLVPTIDDLSSYAQPNSTTWAHIQSQFSELPPTQWILPSIP
ncbi:hypothetical protein C5B42_05710 [Candidatus Cerribacteria bacterium 'Amazon FNV 2010 28 9']|uniref:L,D-TPase catalytic domain-containing protein n=1 Tax=Candidatus Cerribacteria bacterium 'Amazon FNV 2010 28 9' TaxID=2081795 RepID=A0A317JMA5_9BACT|nr:MAG: hypothetical protein C5B42_05710 [Candidatus Cerribacteria bacterium 'Amazon FNV 2010 28 9']